MARRILIVEDDAALSLLLRKNLVYEGFQVECVANGNVAVERALDTRPDLVLLDVTIPGLDGFLVCQRLNSGANRVPVIMLTARTQPADKIHGLAVGADDYVTKPFLLEELMARVHAVLRRARPTVHALTLGAVTVDFGRMRATKGAGDLALTAREFAILHRLAERPGNVVTRDELLTSVWGYNEAPFTRAVDIVMARLRRKIEPDPRHPRFLMTVRGDGYCLVADS